MDKACSMHGTDDKLMTNFTGNLKGRWHLERPRHG
jgi:hypothetical protein